MDDNERHLMNLSRRELVDRIVWLEKLLDVKKETYETVQDVVIGNLAHSLKESVDGKIPRSEWKWMGVPKHFILGHKCQFHMSTKVGDWIVSTVGQLVDGDDFLAEENPNGIEMKEVGAGRFFETMVFKAKEAECGCCEWTIDVQERYDGQPCFAYQTKQEAQEGHLENCEYVAKNQ